MTSLSYRSPELSSSRLLYLDNKKLLFMSVLVGFLSFVEGKIVILSNAFYCL